MAKRSLIDQLDQAVEAMLARSDSAPPPRDPELAGLLRIAADLRDLPSEEFKARLKSDLERKAKMSTAVKPIREGFHTIIPYLSPAEPADPSAGSGAAQLIDFMKHAFQAEELLRVPGPAGRLMHAQLKIGDSLVELADANPEFPRKPSALHLYVKDVDLTYTQALEAGATSLYGPVEQDYGDREAGVQDPAGNHWYIATHRGASYVPEVLRDLTPYLNVHGAAKMIAFLKEGFGGEEIARYQNPDGSIAHAKVRIGDSVLEMGDAHGPYQPMPISFHMYVPDADAAYRRALAAGAIGEREPADQPYGERMAIAKDPFGNYWFIATFIGEAPAR